MKNRFFTVKTIAGLGVLTAMVVVLQILSNYVQFGPVSITLSLFPIAVGAMLYGPLGGLFLGLVDGAIVLTAPSTISFFFAYQPIGTVIICLLKTGIAGLVAGFIFKLKDKDINIDFIAALILLPFLFVSAMDKMFMSLQNNYVWGRILVGFIRLLLAGGIVFLVVKGIVNPKRNTAIFLASISVPIVNTFLFSIAALTMFAGKIMPLANATGQHIVQFLIFSFIGWNFFLEFGINAALASSFHNAYKTIERNHIRR